MSDPRVGSTEHRGAGPPRAPRIGVELLLFAQLADAAGRRRLELSLAPGATVAELWGAVAAIEPALAAALAPWRGRVAVARNERYASPGELLEDGDVLALIPPVSGG